MNVSDDYFEFVFCFFVILDIIFCMMNFLVVENLGVNLFMVLFVIGEIFIDLSLGEGVVFCCFFNFFMKLVVMFFLIGVVILFEIGVFGCVMVIVFVKVIFLFKEWMENFVSKIVMESIYCGVCEKICWKS